MSKMRPSILITALAVLGCASGFQTQSIVALRPRTEVSRASASLPADGSHPAHALAPAPDDGHFRPRGLRQGAIVLSTFTAALALKASAAIAVAETAGEHLHLGEKVARAFQGRGLPDEAVVTLISAMPVVELRGAVPVGIWMGMPPAKVLGLCCIGNMLPILPLLYGLRLPLVQKLLKPVLDRAQSKASQFADPNQRPFLLAAFVGIPLPGTGAWTGAMGAFLLGMPVPTAVASIGAGVVCSGLIMTAISVAGKAGGIAVGLALIGGLIAQTRGSKN